MSLWPLFEWMNNTPLGEAVRTSKYLFPVVETIHLLALSLLGGAVLLVDLRLAGFGMRQQRVSELASDAQPWLVGSIAVMLVTGFLLFLSEVAKCYESDAFRVKMLFLLLALIFTFTIRRKVTASADSVVTPRWGRLVGFVSVFLWTGVGLAGRGIGFL